VQLLVYEALGHMSLLLALNNSICYLHPAPSCFVCVAPQLLVYDALGFTPPAFGHMSLILAPDKSKLSKRHGATSVGDFKAQVGQGQV
jgi:hypothetical protein